MRRNIVSYLCDGLVLVVAACAQPAIRNQEYAPNKLAEINVNLGVAYMEEGKYETAFSKLQKALALDPRYPQVHNALGILHNRLGEMDEAEQHYRRAVELDPSNPGLLNNYGQFLCQSGRKEEATDLFLRAVEDPFYETPEVAYTNAGLCAMNARDIDTAEKYFRKALSTNPKLPHALYQMALISYEKGRYLPARGYLARYLKVASHNAQTLWLGIRIERELGDKDAIASYALSLRANYPDSEETRLLLESED